MQVRKTGFYTNGRNERIDQLCFGQKEYEPNYEEIRPPDQF